MPSDSPIRPEALRLAQVCRLLVPVAGLVAEAVCARPQVRRRLVQARELAVDMPYLVLPRPPFLVLYPLRFCPVARRGRSVPVRFRLVREIAQLLPLLPELGGLGLQGLPRAPERSGLGLDLRFYLPRPRFEVGG